MFFPKDMNRVTVVSHRAHLKQVIDALYDTRVLHIKEHIPKEGDYYPIGSPMENAERISGLLLLLNSLKAQLGAGGVEEKPLDGNLGRMEGFLKRLKGEMDTINQESKEIEEEIRCGERKREALEFLKETGLKRFEALRGYSNLEVMAGYVRDMEIFREKIRGIDSEFMVSDKKGEKGYPAVIFVRSADSEKAREILQQSGFSRIDLDFEWKGKEIREEFEEYSRHMKGLEERKARLRKETGRIARENCGKLLGMERSLKESITKSEVPLRFAVSDHSFIVQGWLPEGEEGNLEKRLSGITGSMYFDVEKCKREKAPTQLDNKGPFKPFEFFLRLYTLPKYKEIDPTFLVFVTYPVIFGIMLGDIGYGLVLFCVFAFIRFRMKKLKSVSSVLMFSAAMTVAAGFFFGEFFGTEQIMGYELHPLIHRSGHNLNQLLIMAVSIGVVHVNLGILFGFVNELKSGKYRHALGKFSWFVFQAGGIIYGLELLLGMKILDPNLSLGIMLAGVVGLAVGEGFMGIVEIPTLISNILSYARIAAVGLASVSLAFIVNQMAGGMFEAGGVMVIMGVALLIGGHAINTIIGLLDSFLQSLRLHYVEMFSKFYHGNGEQYKPFGT